MQVDVADLSSVSKKLTFTLPTTKVDAALSEAYDNLRKEVRLKGFRRGKVPRRVLESRFGKHIQNEVGGQLISEAFDSTIKEHEIVPVAQPVVEPGTLKKGNEFVFSVTVEVKPDIAIENWDGIDVEWPAVQVADEEVERELESIRSRNSTVEAIEDESYEASTGDIAMVTASYTVEGREEPWTITDLMVVVNQPMGFGSADWLGDKIEGMTIAAPKVLEGESVPDDAIGDEWNGTTGTLEIKLGELKTNKLPELDDELAQDEGFDSLDLLKADITFKLQEMLSAHAREAAAKFALEKLSENNEFDVPEGLIRSEAQNILQEQINRMLQGGGGRIPKVNLDDLQDEQKTQLLAEGEFSVRRTLILEAIATQLADEVQVTDADLDGRIEELATQMGQQPAAVKGLLQKNGRMEDLRAHLREEKALDIVLERANVIEVDPTAQAADEAAQSEDATAEADASEDQAEGPDEAAE